VQHGINLIKGKADWKRTKLTEAEYKRLKAAGLPIHEVEKEGSWLWRHYDYGNRKVTQQELQEQIIKTFRKGGLIPAKVNLVGWSRGGISCHMLANAMAKDPALQHIAVNIFAIDPVPGPLNFQHERVSLGKNVREYVGFYARDERSKGFACVIPKTDPATKVSIFPMAGRHATLVGNAAANGSSGPAALPEAGQLTRHYAEICLTRWGVALNKKLDLSAAKISDLHQRIVLNEAAFTAMRKFSYTGLTEQNNSERSVSLGDKGAAFSSISGNGFKPEAGLAASLVKDHTAYKDIH
jgi:hypothetical protein